MKHRIGMITLMTALSLTVPAALAHEGHDQAPGSIKAMHGGIPKAGKSFNLEMLASGTKVQFYPLPHEGESVDAAKIQLTGTAKSPKGKPQTLKITPEGTGFTTTVDFEKSHRVNLDIKATYEGKTDTFKFLVEK